MKFIKKREVFTSIKRKWKNNGFRSLYESIIYPEVELALEDWKQNCGEGVLIGGLALSFYMKPRATEDIDLVFITEEDIPTDVYKFKRIRSHSFLHIKTHVEVEVLSAEFLNRDIDTFKYIYEKSIESDGIKVASPVCLIALKLPRFNNQDKVDIINLKKYCLENNIEIDLSHYNLTDEQMSRYNDLDEEINENVKSICELEYDFLMNKNINYDVKKFDGYQEIRFENNDNFFIKKGNDLYYLNENREVIESSNNYNKIK